MTEGESTALQALNLTRKQRAKSALRPTVLLIA